jgi:hypothetical protein
MINLLPEKEKRELVLEENKKIALIFVFFILVFLISFNLILLSIKANIESNLVIQRTQLFHKEREFQEIDISDLQEKINKANFIFSKLKYFYHNQIDLVNIFEQLSKAMPEEIYLQSFSFQLKEEEEFLAEVSLSGFAKTQRSLFEFRKDLKEIEDFSDVYFPLSSWVKLKDIEFSSRFKIKK